MSRLLSSPVLTIVLAAVLGLTVSYFMRTKPAPTTLPNTITTTSAHAISTPPDAEPPPTPPQPSESTEFAKIEHPHLPNVRKVTDKILAGARPEEEETFKALSELGVKTIISLDGAKPNLEVAEKYGMRYVHLPITYAQVTEQQGKEIAKALMEMPGKIYAHCPQGINRSAAAVATACVVNRTFTLEQAQRLLKAFGTSKNYKGLVTSVEKAQAAKPGELESMKVEFVSSKKVPELADAMVGMDHNWENLVREQKAKWGAPPDHPSLDPAVDSRELYAHYFELKNLASIKNKPADFHTTLHTGTLATQALAEILRVKPVDTQLADAAHARVKQSCQECHKAHRD
ncbi:MAG: hypothetical protein WCT04_15745 [Planctomycetota bacterium]